jgi:hypothetical protein
MANPSSRPSIRGELREGGSQIADGALELRCRVSGQECPTVVGCRQWGCRAGDEALAAGLRGVAAALDLLGRERND